MKKKKYVIVGIIVVAILVALFIGFGRNSEKNTSSKNNDVLLGEQSELPFLLGDEIPVLGREHVSQDTEVTYNSNPPTSGDHWRVPSDWGFYDEPVPDRNVVHNLEHGGIWISYKEVDEATKQKLIAIAEKYPLAVIVTPREENDSFIALSSWGRLLKLETYDEEIIEQFIQTNVNNSPEELASLESDTGEIKKGSPFPNFMLNNIDGTTITRESLNGKPSLIWFATSECVPCQIGAQDVAKLDTKLGGEAFNVLVIFVDLEEKSDDLEKWRDEFVNPDWLIAFDNSDNSFARKVRLQFLDTKILLSNDGTVQNIEPRQVTEAYIELIRSASKSS